MIDLFVCIILLVCALLADFFYSNKPRFIVGALLCMSTLIFTNPIVLYVFVLIVMTLFLLYFSKWPSSFYSCIDVLLVFGVYYLVLIVFQLSHFNLNQFIVHVFALFMIVMVLSISLDMEDLIRVVNRCLMWFMFAWAFLEFDGFQFRTIGPVETSTGFGVLMCITWSMDFVYSYMKRSSITYLIVQLIAFFLALSSTGTRMGLLSILITFMYIAVVITFDKKNMFKWFYKVAKMLVVFLFICVVFWYLLPSDFSLKARLVDGMQYNGIDESNIGRLLAWDTSFKALNANFLFGVGLGNFEKYMIQIHPIMPLYHAHNIYLFILSEMGVWGFTCFLVFTVLFVITILKNLKFMPVIVHALIIGYLVMFILGFFDNVPFYASTQFMAVWLVCLYSSLRRENQNHSLSYAKGSV